MTKSKSAFLLSVQQLARCHSLRPDELYLWTFTLPTVMSIKEAKAKWNHLLTLLHQRFPRQRGIRVFELHDTHGLHVHLLCCYWMDVRDVRALAEQVGWGRINVRTIPVTAAGNYLSKKFSRRERCLKGWRLWESVGNWVSTKGQGHCRQQRLHTGVSRVQTLAGLGEQPRFPPPDEDRELRPAKDNL